MLGYHPQVILAGRRINDSMGKYVAEETIKTMIQNGQSIKGADVIVLGLTFKENCPDLRNSKVIDVIRELKSYGVNVHVHDPVAESAEGRTRIRREPHRLGQAPEGRRHRRRRRPQGIRRNGRGRAVRKARAERRLHRREELLRPGRDRSGRRQNLASVSGQWQFLFWVGDNREIKLGKGNDLGCGPGDTSKTANEEYLPSQWCLCLASHCWNTLLSICLVMGFERS